MEKVNLESLKSHLWKSADILRGHIDAADYKNYIFGFLFLKRISDVFDEAIEELNELRDKLEAIKTWYKTIKTGDNEIPEPDLVGAFHQTYDTDKLHSWLMKLSKILEAETE